MRIVAGQRAYGPQQGTSDDHKMLPGGAGVWAMDCVMARVAGDWRFARTLMSCLCRPMAGGSTPSALGRRYAGGPARRCGSSDAAKRLPSGQSNECRHPSDVAGRPAIPTAYPRRAPTLRAPPRASALACGAGSGTRVGAIASHLTGSALLTECLGDERLHRPRSSHLLRASRGSGLG